MVNAPVRAFADWICDPRVKPALAQPQSLVETLFGREPDEHAELVQPVVTSVMRARTIAGGAPLQPFDVPQRG